MALLGPANCTVVCLALAPVVPGPNSLTNPSFGELTASDAATALPGRAVVVDLGLTEELGPITSCPDLAIAPHQGAPRLGAEGRRGPRGAAWEAQERREGGPRPRG